MSWDDIAEIDAKSEFTKLEAGKPVIIHIVGTGPEKSVKHWVSGKPVICAGDDCGPCKDRVKKSTRFSVGVFNLTTNHVEVLDGGISIFRQINNIRDAYDGNIDGLDMKITRSGTGAMDTEYSVVPIPTKFKPEMMASPADEKLPF